MSCSCNEPCASDTELPPRALGAHALRIFEYLELREKAESWPEAQYDPDVVEELLAHAKAARQSFRVVATPALRTFRLLEGRGRLNDLFDGALKEVGKGASVLELAERAVASNDVQALLQREGISKQRLEGLRGALKSSGVSASEEKGALRLKDANGVRLLRRDPKRDPRAPNPSLLRSLGRSWSTGGRGLAGPVFEGGPVKEIFWRDGLANALVNADWFFDRDVRDLEDRCALPVAKGADAGTAIGLIIAAVGIVLILIANCVDDPGLAEALFIIGSILTAVGAGVLVASGVPVSACAPDPTTGAPVCGRI